MHIISKFKDYYDSVVQTTGVDKTHVFERHTEELEPNIKISDKNIKIRHCTKGYREEATKENPDIWSFIVGFCGKIYIGWNLTWKEKNPYTYADTEIQKITYDKNEIVKILNKHKPSRWSSENKIHDLNVFYETIENNKELQLFYKYHVPYFKAHLNHSNKYFSYYRGTFIEKLILYPNLKELEFFKVFDPFSAFQEIDMYYFGVLGSKENELSEVPEEYRMASRGMDKTSFRQIAPGDKKEKRRANKAKKRERKNKQ